MHETTALLAASIALAAIAVAAVATVSAGREHRAEPAPGLRATAFRYCPNELRTRAAVRHRDGTATCCDCGTHIDPVGD